MEIITYLNVKGDNKMEEKKEFLEWAMNEVNLASETADAETEDAMRQAYHLIDEYLYTVDASGHSKAFDFFLTLLKGAPLTPLEDREEDWADTVRIDIFSHKRRPSLYKKSNKDGGFDFVDMDRFVLINALDNARRKSSVVDWYMNKALPIEFPYMPSDLPIRVYGIEFEYEDRLYTRIRAVSLPKKMKSLNVSLMCDENKEVREISSEEFTKVYEKYIQTIEEAVQND